MENLQSVESKPLKIAVIGGGVAGIISAYLLQRKHQVTIFEQNSYLGGHTNTVDVPQELDNNTAIDTGFIVLNDQNYPNLHKFLDQLAVKVQYSCMSFGYFCEQTGFCYAGTDLNGLFANRSNLINPKFWSMLLEIKRFSQEALAALNSDRLSQMTLGEFIRQKNFSKIFQQNYLLPISAAIWSAGDEKITDFPAKMFISFFKNHGLLSVRDRPRWQTIIGGSRSYVTAFKQTFSGRIRLASPINSIVRYQDKVTVISKDQTTEEFDKVVIATHADQAFKLLSDPSNEEKNALAGWEYSKNHTVLHTDPQFLPAKRRAWASWNYRRVGTEAEPGSVIVTYHMNRLQNLKKNHEYCVTLNPPPARKFEQSSLIYEVDYEHPVFNRASLSSQDQLHHLNGQNNTYYCGSYFGHGFHEDAVVSALNVCKAFGEQL